MSLTWAAASIASIRTLIPRIHSVLRFALTSRGRSGRVAARGLWNPLTLINDGKGEDGYVNYVDGANIAGFVKVADAMLAYGVV